MKDKERLPVKVEQENKGLTDSFSRAAMSLSRQFGLDVTDIKNAYKDKPDSLTLLNDTVKDAKDRRGSNIFWTVVAGIFIWPLAAWPGYYIYRNTKQIDGVKETLQNEVMRQRLIEDRRANPGPR